MDEDKGDRRARTPHLRRLVLDYFETAMGDYARADFPLGSSLTAMMIWFEYGQHTMRN